MQLVVVLGVVAVLAGWAGAVEPCPLTFSNSLDSTSDSSEFVGNWYRGASTVTLNGIGFRTRESDSFSMTLRFAVRRSTISSSSFSSSTSLYEQRWVGLQGVDGDRWVNFSSPLVLGAGFDYMIGVGFTSSILFYEKSLSSTPVCSGLEFEGRVQRSISSTSSTVGSLTKLSTQRYTSILLDVDGAPSPPPPPPSPPFVAPLPPPPTDHSGNLWTAITVFAVLTGVLGGIILCLLCCLCISQKADVDRGEPMPVADGGKDVGADAVLAPSIASSTAVATSSTFGVASASIAYNPGAVVGAASAPPVYTPAAAKPAPPAVPAAAAPAPKTADPKTTDIINHRVGSTGSSESSGYSSGYSSVPSHATDDASDLI